ncbi:MAG: cation diffusion facilitator family transporter [Paludibacter sp.]|jgi:cation diffusion facilitator family transporter|nr:cation diffusion facilitator family transporter [Paludibacter sp.]
MNDKNKIILRTSWISVIGNGVLSALKLVIGFVSGSLAVLGDGIDSATDVVVSVVMVFTSRIISKPPDREHVYGHEKAESIATKILSFVIFYAGLQMLFTSVKQTFWGETREMPSMLALYVTAFSIVGKLGLALYQFRQGKKIDSPMLLANAKNMRNDVLISGSVLVGLFFTFALKLPVLDAVTGIVVSLFILKTAIGIFMDSNIELMDSVKDVSVYDRIFQAVTQTEGASRPHRVRTRTIGGLYLISLDIEVSGELTVTEAHNITNEVENNIRRKIENINDIRIHVEPQGTVHNDEKFGLEI